MRILLLAVLFVIVHAKGFTQEIIFDFSSKEFIPSEITLNDGSIMNGFIKDFTLPKSVEFRGLGYDFSSIESKLNLDATSIKYRSSKEGSTELLDIKNIKSILLKSEDTVRYEKLKLKTINTKNEVIDLNREVMIPLLKEGPINLYGLTAYSCQNGCEMMYVIAYIKNVNQDYAYIPIDYNRVNIFNLGSMDDKFIKAFEEAGSDCPEFLEYLKKNKKNFADKEYRKDAKANYKQFQKDKKEKLKDIKGSRNKKIAEDKMNTAYFLKMYTDIIDEYTSRCK